MISKGLSAYPAALSMTIRGAILYNIVESRKIYFCGIHMLLTIRNHRKTNYTYCKVCIIRSGRKKHKGGGQDLCKFDEKSYSMVILLKNFVKRYIMI